MAPKRIAYVCAPEQVEAVEKSFCDFETKNVGLVDKPLDIYKSALRFASDVLVIFDCGIEDGVIVDVAKRAKTIAAAPEAADISLPEIAFVGDGLRDQYDPIYTDLFKQGVSLLAGPVGNGEYDMYAEATDLLVNGPGKHYLSHVMTNREYAQSAATRIEEEEDGAISGAQEKIHKMVSICVFQCAPRNGSTHLSISIASSLRAIGYRVALVLPERHFNELKDCYTSAASPLSDGGYNYFGIGVYPGDTANVPNAADYDYIVLDQGTVSWFKTRSRTLAQQSEYREFNQANIAVWSSFMTPTGQWSLTVPDEDGVRPLNDFVVKSSLGKIRFAVFGVDEADISLAATRINSIAGREVSLVGIEPFVNPFMTVRGSARRIPESIAKLLGSGIVDKATMRKIEKYIQAQKDLDIEKVRAGEPVEEKERPEGFLGRFLGGWGKSR